MSSSNLITVFTSDETINKTAHLDKKGELVKTSSGLGSTVQATTFDVPDLDTFAALYEVVSGNPNQCIMLGGFKGIPANTPFTVLSEREYRKLARISFPKKIPHKLTDTEDCTIYTARLKKFVVPSAWFGLDFDNTPGMPDELASLTQRQKISKIGKLIPGFSKVGYVFVPSSTSRIKIKGKQQSSSNFHIFFQIEDPNDLERLGSALLINSFDAGLGFKRPVFSHDTGEVIAYRPWTIFDPTTFSRERIWYEGAPTSLHKDITIAPAKIEVKKGGKVDSSKVPTPEKGVEGMNMRLSSDGSSCYIQDTETLNWDTEFETTQGWMTLREFKNSAYNRLRCQAFNRPDSTSWNGYLSRHKDGSPFFFDNGTRQKFDPPKISRRAMIAKLRKKLEQESR